MADQNQNLNIDTVEGAEQARFAADEKRKADEAAAAEEKRKADEAAIEAAKQNEIEANVEDSEPEAVYVSVILDPEYADECDCDVAYVGTANGEYTLSSTPTDVPQSDLENVLVSPAAKEQN